MALLMFWRSKVLTNKELAEFKRIAFQIYGVKLTDSEALEQGSRLIQLFELLIKSKQQLASKAIILNKKVVQISE